MEDGILGSAGLMGRQQIVRVPDAQEMEPVVQQAAKVMPPNCLRVFQSPRGHDCSEAGGHGFVGQCPGLQEDGSCLLGIVRRANEQGVEWQFEVAWDQWGNQSWRYVGAPLA